jgi:hypothetical protein
VLLSTALASGPAASRPKEGKKDFMKISKHTKYILMWIVISVIGALVYGAVGSCVTWLIWGHYGGALLGPAAGVIMFWLGSMMKMTD